MHRLSLQKTRWLFFAFFLALVIPASILSFKAHEQLRWQTLHQFQQDVQTLAQQIDTLLAKAIDKEEARADTDYTFFVLAGSPEARFVQRSELSKYPVESELEGVIGYFQIDENGLFSSPILPSAYVQSEVQPILYGISQEENQLRKELEQSVRSILSQNKLVVSQHSKNETSGLGESLASPPKENADIIEQDLAESSLLKKASSDIDDDLDDSFADSAEISGDNFNTKQEQKITITGSRLAKTKDNKLKRKVDTGFRQLVDAENKRKAKQKQIERSLAEKKQLEKEKQEKELVNRQQSYSVDNRSVPRKKRLEKNYSPQQSLVAEQEPSQRLEQDQIQIDLFESEVEPFKFSLLESGHFVVYRQVLRNNKRVIQGAVLLTTKFVNANIMELFENSGLAELVSLNVKYDKRIIGSSIYKNATKLSSSNKEQREEDIATISLSEPFGLVSLDFNVVQLPTSPGAAFIKLVTGSLLLVLVLGTYFLYRLTIKQSNLVQQQQDFVSSVSHELRTPLTSIRMYGEILKQGWVSDAKREEYYDYIYTESERLSRLIANVLQISKVSHNALQLDLKPVDISELASLIKSKVDSQIAQSEFTLDISVEEKIKQMAISVDSDAFVQVIINLVDNAIKYSAKADKKHIDIGFYQSQKNQISVSVRDFGPGIAKDQIKQVFELFYRSGDEMTREVTGTGIGLALVKELVELMRAKIAVINHNIGVEFTLKFPSIR